MEPVVFVEEASCKSGRRNIRKALSQNLVLLLSVMTLGFRVYCTGVIGFWNYLGTGTKQSQTLIRLLYYYRALGTKTVTKS